LSPPSKSSKSICIGIDASRNRSGGAVTHIIGILSCLKPESYGIREVHIWSFKKLLEKIPDKTWLVKRNPPALEKTLLHQLFWQKFQLSDDLKSGNCDILFTTDASTVSRFKPMVVLSQDMLSYEPGVMQAFGLTSARVRLELILFLQNFAMRHASGVIFLSKYAAQVIQKSCGKLSNDVIINHGVDDAFKKITLANKWPENSERPVKCLYISNTDIYKHQWIVVEAIHLLRKRGLKICVEFIGGGSGKAQQRLDKAIKSFDAQKTFVISTGFVAHNDLPLRLAQADLFIFASSCENMPVTLIEAMASGLPIACSDRGPMREFLKDGGVYFNPENPESIAQAVDELVTDEKIRLQAAKKAKELSEQYSWSRCSDETFNFIVETYRSLSNG
jgi:glycosyltransferase involved in cell wall biosynthesis